MGRFQTVVSNRSSGSDAGVHDGSPALQPMVMVAVKKIGNAYGRTGPGSFDRQKGGVVVNDLVIQQGFVASATPEIECGEVVERTSDPDRGEEPVIPAIPEAMFVVRCDWLGWAGMVRSGRWNLLKCGAE